MEKLIEQIINEGYLKSPEIIEAFLRIDRADFIRSDFWGEAYGNYPLQIGFNQTISQPATVAFMLELLKVKKGDKVLDVGSGSGWQAALLATLAGHTGKVFAIERIKELKEFGEQNCSKYNFDNITFIEGDGSKEQLKIGGRLVIPVGEVSQDIVLIERIKENKYREERHPGFVFVPLISEE